MSSFARLASVGAVVRAMRLAVRPGGPTLGQRAGAVPRLVRATAKGDYRGTSPSRLLLMMAAAGYIVSPVDLLPEGVLGVIGLADDAMVLSWLATRLVEETEKFLEWERTQAGAPAPGTPYGAPGSAGGASGSPYPPYPGASGSPYPPYPQDPGASGPPRSAAGSQTVPGDVVP